MVNYITQVKAGFSYHNHRWHGICSVVLTATA